MALTATVKLGDKWNCECGKEHIADGGYLAAHWDIDCQHSCEGCGRVHAIMRGRIRLIMDPPKRRKKS